MLGQLVKTILIRNGSQRITWNAVNDNGDRVHGGMNSGTTNYSGAYVYWSDIATQYFISTSYSAAKNVGPKVGIL